MIEKLANQNKYYVLSRPRYFDKTPLLNTLGCLFEGREALFDRLYIHDKWGWQQRHPVVRLSFGSSVMQNRQELDVRIRDQLHTERERLRLTYDTDIAGEFE